MTATAALQLWQQRKLDLDAPVQRYCPAFPAREWPVTTRDLLQHRAGIRDKTPAEEFNTRHFTTIAAALDVFKDDPLLARPGTTFRYTSYGYNIVGCVIEGASGIPYGEYMRRFIFDAAGMTHTRIEDSREKLAARVTGYRRDSTSSLRPSLDDDASNRIPAGGFLLTAIDLARFGVATIRGTLLADSTRAMMTRFVPLPDAPPPSEPGGYALGWSVSEWNGEPEWWHGGGSPQISAFIYALPTKQFVVAFLMNLEGAPARGDLAGEIAKIVLGPDAPTRK
jgi:CubicO group peptidase (beta-lactamase class C family)